MRKITVITYLNDEVPPKSKKGELRLYLKDRIVNIVPRMGRSIIFKSETVEHEVRPTFGYDRYAVTSWFHELVPETTKLVNQF